MSFGRHFSAARGPRNDNQPLRVLRAAYGLTQEWLAGFLGVPRTAVSMEESVGRGLPLLAQGLLLPLYQQLATPVPAAEPSAAALAEARAALDFRRREVALEVDRLSRQQEKLSIRLGQARRRQQALPALLAALPPPPADEDPRLHLSLWPPHDRAQLRHDEAALLQLELRLRVLAFEQAELAKLLAPDAEAG